MHTRIAPAFCTLLAAAMIACGSNTPAQPSTPAPAPTPTPTPTPAPAPKVVISAPTLVAPLNGVTSTGWPTFTVIDAVASGPASPLVYRFDVSTSAAFTTLALTTTVSETPGQTSFTPPAATPAPPQAALFWRVVAIDPFNVVSSPVSTVQTFTFTAAPSAAALLAAQQGVTLWSGVQPPGTAGHATLGNGWTVGPRVAFNGSVFESPELDELQIFDLLDHGLDPQAAVDWMHNNGYATSAAYYADVSVIGFRYQYIALIGGVSQLVTRVGA